MWNSLFNKNNLMIYCYGLLLLASVLINVCQGSHSSLHVVNGYKGVVIALSPEITVDNHEDFITKTKDLIDKSSKVLFDATDSRLFFEEVTIIVPNSWKDVDSLLTADTPSQRYTDADIIITNGSSVQSFSMQFAGCGQHALPIVMTKQLIDPTGGAKQIGDTSRLLIQEWAHYRFGVFNEFGFPSDPIYPAYYSIAGNPEPNPEVLINACTDNKKFNYESYKVDGSQCQPLSTSVNNGMPTEPQCIPLPDLNNNTFESSLMYSHSVVSVSKFCGSHSTNGVHKHNVDSPNKQNVFCDGKDVWTVINSHKDMASGRYTTFQTPNIKIWREDKSPRTLFAIQNTDNMQEKSRDRMIRGTLTKFHLLDLPDSQMAMFTFSSGTIIDKYNWAKASDQQDNVKFLKFDQKSQSLETDLNKVLSEGIPFFNDGKGGIFVIFISGKDIVSWNSVPQITNVCNQLRDLNVKLKIILFPVFDGIDARKHSSQLFEAAISVTGGQVFPIKEEIISDKDSISTGLQIMKAFSSILSDHSGDSNQNYHLIREQVFTTFNEKKVQFEFTVDNSMVGKDLRAYVLLARPDTDIMVNVKLVDPIMGVTDKLNMRKSDFVRGFRVHIDRSDKIGKWKFTAEVLDLQPGDSVVAIAEIATNSLDENVLTAECWLNTDIEYKYSDGPVIAYLNLNKKLDGLVSDAEVKLVVRQSESRYYNVPTADLPLQMLDDGKGDPDITKGDGIYSQYIVNIRNQGYYTVSALITEGTDVSVTRNFGSTSLTTNATTKSCCGSKVSGTVDKHELSGPFTRSVECGSFFRSTNNNNIEDYPPNTVRDLRVENVDFQTVTLRWTSTGADYTSSDTNSRVREYELRAFNGSENDSELRKQIKRSFNSPNFYLNYSLTENLKQNYGEEEQTVITISKDEAGLYYFALRAVDDRGHKSGVSNIVMAHIKSNVKIPSTTALVDVSIYPVEGGNGRDTSLAGLRWWEWLSIGIGIAVVLLLVIIISICFIGKKRRKEDENDRRNDAMPQRRAPDPPRVSPELEKSQSILLDNASLTHSVEKIPNISVNGIHQTNSAYDSQQNLRELSANTLSYSNPKQSWDANELLNHWGRVQEAKSRHEKPPVLRIEDLESASSNRSQSYASSEDDNTAIYTNPNNWRYQDVTARPTYIHNGFNEPIYRSSVEPIRSNTPSDAVPRYSTINRIPTQNVSQV